MKRILLNLALIGLNNFVKESGIDTGTAGSFVVKSPREFRYTLVTADTKRELASVVFSPSSVPVYSRPI